MHTGLSNYKLLAFICAFKAWRKHSRIHSHDKNYIIAGKLGMSPAAVKKYLSECRALGILREGTFINLGEIMIILFPGILHHRHISFFKAFEKVPCFKTYYARITFAFFKTNIDQQNYRIKQGKIIDSLKANRHTGVSPRKLRALYRKYGVQDLENLLRVARRNPLTTTGKFHLSKLLGISTSTASRLLSQWDKQGLIKRTIVVDFIRILVNQGSIESMEAGGNRRVIPNKALSGFYINRGSVIEIPEPTP